MKFLAAIISEDRINQINSAATGAGAGEIATQTKNIIFDALGSFILPIAFFLVAAYAVYGAIQYFTAYGSDEKAARGKKIMTWAIVGAVVIAGAFLIVRYVLSLLGTSDSPLTG